MPGLFVLNFYSAIFVDQLKRGRKVATIRLGDKSRKYKRGLVVWVTGRDEAKRARALELGAHEVFEPGARMPARADAVLETVGKATWSHSMKSLRPGGTLVVSGATTGADPSADLNRLFFLQLRVIGSTMGTRSELASLMSMMDATGVRPVIDRALPMEDAREGFEAMAAGEVFGKVVLTR